MKISNVKKENKSSNKYYIYIIECENGILYTGVTTDYNRRFEEHAKLNNSKKGAKFTKSHKPEKILALWKTNDRSNAQKLESQIKKLTKDKKNELIIDNARFKDYFKGILLISKYRRIKIRGIYA